MSKLGLQYLEYTFLWAHKLLIYKIQVYKKYYLIIFLYWTQQHLPIVSDINSPKILSIGKGEWFHGWKHLLCKYKHKIWDPQHPHKEARNYDTCL